MEEKDILEIDGLAGVDVVSRECSVEDGNLIIRQKLKVNASMERIILPVQFGDAMPKGA